MSAISRDEIAAANRARFPKSFEFLAELRAVFGPECAPTWVVEGEEFTGPVPFDQLPSFVGPRQPICGAPVANELAFFQHVAKRCDEDVRALRLADVRRMRK